jgi:hypothetical protein
MTWNKLSLKIGLFVFFTIVLNQSCGIYSLSGVNIPPDIKSISISYFPNQAPQVAPTLSQVFTEKLRDKFQNETKLFLQPEQGDYQISGVISQYSIQPVSIGGNTAATENRLTIATNVEFVCPKYPDMNFSKSFSNFLNFDASRNLSPELERQLIDQVSEMLVQDIFNAIALKW